MISRKGEAHTQASNAEDGAPPSPLPDELRGMDTHGKTEEDTEDNPCSHRRRVPICGIDSMNERVAASLQVHVLEASRHFDVYRMAAGICRRRQ